MNPLKVFVYQLYLLQLENYELSRYFKLLFSKGFYGNKAPQRKQIEWTMKIKLVALLGFLLALILAALTSLLNLYVAVLVLLISLFLMPLFFALATILGQPLDFYFKWRWTEKAKKLVRENPQMKIIGIAGSYGKTTTKSVIAAVLGAKLKVMSTPESINTPVGIARWLVNRFESGTEVLVVEMGEHYVGDVKLLCGITPPDFAVITGINEAHFERLGSLKATTDTIFEIVAGAKKGAKFFLNSDDHIIKKTYLDYLGEKQTFFYSDKTKKVTKKHFDLQKLAWDFDLAGVGKVELPVLGEYFIGKVELAAEIAKELGLSPAEIMRGIRAIAPAPHRLEPIRGAGGVLVIDDSYNGNLDGVHEAIKTLSRFTDKRKIYLTPGLVELGSKNAEVHEIIGKELAAVADLVVLVRNSATPYIEKGLIASGYEKNHIIWYDDANSAHEDLANILRPNDVILFQNDWGDQYL